MVRRKRKLIQIQFNAVLDISHFGVHECLQELQLKPMNVQHAIGHAVAQLTLSRQHVSESAVGFVSVVHNLRLGTTCGSAP